MTFELQAPGAVARIDPSAGGRLASLAIDGVSVLIERSDDAMRWGCFPMVPFAGRLREGRFDFDGERIAMPTNLPPHAIHGTGYTSRWEPVEADTIGFELGTPWRWTGRVTQRFELVPGRLTIRMTLFADETMPAMLGWHPWFRRELGRGAPLELSFLPARMYELDAMAIPTGRLIEPPAGPWDNCFTALAHGPRLDWRGALRLELGSTADHWVIYDEPADAICVEPQTGPPDAFNRGPQIVEAGATLAAEFWLAWG